MLRETLLPIVPGKSPSPSALATVRWTHPACSLAASNQTGADMSSTHDSSDAPGAKAALDGFNVLDACHRQTLTMLDTLAALVARLGHDGLDAQARAVAKDIVQFFSITARQHHEDEERHVFPKLLAGDDAAVVQTVMRLQQDHHWLEEDWLELSPHLDAVAAGQNWYDLDVLRQGVDVFTALSHDHVALEESCIYPQARAKLGTGERREMGREMAERRRSERAAQSASTPPKRT
jgi:hemerythrin-like domain-containing protein